MLVQSLFNRLNRLDFDTALRVAMRNPRFRAKHCERELEDQECFAKAVAFYSNTRFKFGPVALTTTLTTNIFNPGTTTGGVACTSAPFDKLYVILNHIRIVNKTGSAATVSLWIGATGANVAGTEFAWQGTSVPANSYIDWYGIVRLSTADFLVGGAGTGTALSITGEGEIGVGA